MNRQFGIMMRVLLTAILLLSFVGCGSNDDTQPLRIGAKGFTEQRILAEMAAQLIRAEPKDYPVGPIVSCPDTFSAQRMIVTGQVDVMLEYTGTWWLFNKGPVPKDLDDEELFQRIKRESEVLGYRWLNPLGFENRYRLLVTAERAAALGLETIGDLRKLDRPIRVSCPPESVRRPIDGLYAMALAYDLKLDRDRILLEDDVNERVHDLLDGRVDVMTGYSTDGAIDRLGLTVLEDDQHFFPSYQAAFIVREDVPGEVGTYLSTILGRLRGHLNESVMRRLNDDVETRNMDPAEVARQFLLDEELIQNPDDVPLKRLPKLVIAQAEADALSSLSQLASETIGTAFPDRVIELRELPDRDPFEEVLNNQARVALVGAERFFRIRPGRPTERREQLRALTVIGNRLVHVIRRSNESGSSVPDPLSGRVGLSPPNSGSALVGHALLEGRDPAMQADVATLCRAVLANQLDAAIILAEPGRKEIVEALDSADGALRLASLEGWLDSQRAATLPFLRPSQFEVGLYGIDRIIETLGNQVVLAGAAFEDRELNAGPASALPTGAIPLTSTEIMALVNASPITVAPDPALPQAYADPTQTELITETGDLFESIWMTLLNLAALAFLTWLVAIVRAPEPDPEEDDAPRGWFGRKPEPIEAGLAPSPEPDDTDHAEASDKEKPFWLESGSQDADKPSE